ncbi:glucose-6-phosphate 1-dehydrogenase [Nitrosomonas sp. PY1]|nr:glucose-6-phosphate 1-dehydrogenase [Nitrosomonas sp. PY1]
MTATKLLPALFHLESCGRIAKNMAITAFARREWSLDQWKAHVCDSLKDKISSQQHKAILKRFLKRFRYQQGNFDDLAAYRQLADNSQCESPCTQTVFYLAIKPTVFSTVIKNLELAGLNKPCGTSRIVVEKPFGRDLNSARALNQLLHQSFNEEQIYRIDHFLGKEMVQNLFVFRFANTLIESLWNRNYIDHVEITVAESTGVGNRADYYDQVGALRDMVQNHLLQLLAVVAMEPPCSLDADELRDEKVKVLRTIRPIHSNQIDEYSVRGQYTQGNMDGEQAVGYLQEKNVKKDSITETFAAVKFYIDNWRWSDVPFYLRTGKRLTQQSSMIAIRFKLPPQQLFRETLSQAIAPNWMLFSIQPEKSMKIEIHAKQPGLGMETRITQMDANFLKNNEQGLDAYETLLLDVIEGDRSLFIRFDEVEMAWQVIEPILKHWQKKATAIAIPTYPAGSWGPEDANQWFFNSQNQDWRNTS